MGKYYYRIQPRVSRETFENFQALAAQRQIDMSRLARLLIQNFIDSETRKNKNSGAAT